ncbi:MAG: LysR family transcriptional regulator [Alphaproteobacteria bacterium]
MNDRQLRYALTVWRERSFSKAAGRLNVSQPAVSDQIRMLEEELGFELFQRTGRGVEVTYVGRTFLQHAEQAMSGILGLSETARQLRGDGPRGSFTIGFSSGVAQDIVPRVMASLAEMLPQVRLEVITATTRRIQRFILERRLDAGIAIQSDPRSVPEELISERVGSIEMALIVPWAHPLAKRATAINLADLKDERLIVNEPDIGYGQFVQTVFTDQGLLPNVAARADDVDTIKLMVASGVGLAVLPRGCAANEVALKQMRVLPIRPQHEVPMTLIRHPGALTPAAESCIKRLREALLAEGGDSARASA